MEAAWLVDIDFKAIPVQGRHIRQRELLGGKVGQQPDVHHLSPSVWQQPPPGNAHHAEGDPLGFVEAKRHVHVMPTFAIPFR